MKEKEHQEKIRKHCEELSKKMLEWEKEEEYRRESSKNEVNAFYEGT